MDNIGDLLYLVLMIGAVVFSLVRKKRERGDDAMPEPTRDGTEPFPEWRNWEDGDEVAPAKPEVVAPVPAKHDKSVESPVFTYDSPDQAQPGRSIVKQTASANWEGGAEDEDDPWGGEPFDLRKAVLYSEVLKRPVW